MAGLDEGDDAAVMDPGIAALRARVRAVPSSDVGRDGAAVTLEFADGTTASRKIGPCVGSRERPMSDEALSEKFISQANRVFDAGRSERALNQSWAISEMHTLDALVASLTPD